MLEWAHLNMCLCLCVSLVHPTIRFCLLAPSFHIWVFHLRALQLKLCKSIAGSKSTIWKFLLIVMHVYHVSCIMYHVSCVSCVVSDTEGWVSDTEVRAFCGRVGHIISSVHLYGVTNFTTLKTCSQETPRIVYISIIWCCSRYLIEHNDMTICFVSFVNPLKWLEFSHTTSRDLRLFLCNFHNAFQTNSGRLKGN